MAGERIGRNCVLGQNVKVAPGVVIGNNVKIQNNVSLYVIRVKRREAVREHLRSYGIASGIYYPCPFIT